MRTHPRLAPLVLCAVALAGTAHAHVASNGFLVANVSGQTVTGSIELAVRDVELAVGVDGNRDGKVTWGELRAGEPQLTRYLAQHVSIMAQTQRLPAILPGSAQSMIVSMAVMRGCRSGRNARPRCGS